MQVIRAGDYRRMPWKNGGGETAEVAISPDGASLGEFDWRVSMARVDGDGPFSAFPGVDRTLVILAGTGLVLRVAGRDAVQLESATRPYSFPADAATSADLLDGPITDLNVMTRRTRFSHRVRRELVGPRRALPLSGATALVVCAGGRARVMADGAEEVLSLQDTARLDRLFTSVHIAGEPRAELLVIELEAR